ncbi:cell envelope integrity protein TolA, partial [Serratia sp. DD3]|uniref:cell envelope integrity protein TolA n=1 Tax=Serratia sp. DD3 TaxID=1410619 RepID=UPI000563320A
AKAAAAAEKKAAAEAEKKAAAEKAAAAKKAADEKKKAAEVDDLFGGLADGKNAPKGGSAKAQGDGKPAGQGNAKTAGASGADISGYLGQITAAIQSKFYDADLYKGRTCDLRIKLAPDGLLIDIKSEGGDPALCQAAIAAAKQAHIPKPPTPAVYEVFKNVPITFKPE